MQEGVKYNSTDVATEGASQKKDAERATRAGAQGNSGQPLPYAHLIARMPNHIHNTVEANQAVAPTLTGRRVIIEGEVLDLRFVQVMRAISEDRTRRCEV